VNENQVVVVILGASTLSWRSSSVFCGSVWGLFFVTQGVGSGVAAMNANTLRECGRRDRRDLLA